MIPLWKIKQSDNMRYLLFVENWNYQQRQRVQRVNRPKRADKAAELGYKSKDGYFVYHVRVRRGGRRKVSHSLMTSSGQKSHQLLAETRAMRHVRNLKIVDSYWVSQDGTYKYFEVLMVDPSNPIVKQDSFVMSALARRRRERTEIAGRMISGNLSPPRGQNVGWQRNWHANSSGYGGYSRSHARSDSRW